MARRYEFVEGSSKKFWEIELEGESFTARWGRIGTAGQEKTQDFDSAAEARKAHDKLCAEKEKKGYQLVGGDGPAALPLTFKAISNPTLEGALGEDPDDLNRWKVYADWLLENKEPWGEVIAHACAGKPDTGKQGALEQTFGDDEAAGFEWKNGAVEHFTLEPTEFLEETPMDAGLLRLLKHPAGRLVRKLTLGLPPCDDGDIEWHMEPLAKAIGDAGPLPLLEELDLSKASDHMDQVSWRRLGDIRPVWKAAPRLKTLLLEGSAGSDDGAKVKLAPIDAPCLEKLVFQSGGLDAAAPMELGAAQLPKLKHLELWFGREDYGCSSTVKSLAGILSGKGLPALKTLALKNSEWETELIDAVANSELLPRLEEVDFSMGTMCADATAALVKHAKKFAHLKKLDLNDNYFDDGQQAAISQVLPKAVFGEQKEPDGDPNDEYSRYTSVGE